MMVDSYCDWLLLVLRTAGRQIRHGRQVFRGRPLWMGPPASGALMTADVHHLACGDARVAAAMATDAALAGWWLTLPLHG